MIELSAQDYAAILAAIEPYKFDSGSQVAEMLDACYRAGLAAGIERAVKVCDAERNFSEVMPMREPEEREYARGWRSACWGCAAAIRALNAPAAP